LCASVDIAKINISIKKELYNYEQQPYYHVDMDFIRPIVHRLRINDQSLSEDDVRRAFESYTLLTLDLSLASIDDPKSQ